MEKRETSRCNKLHVIAVQQLSNKIVNIVYIRDCGTSG
jgi:hypothetical protein